MKNRKLLFQIMIMVVAWICFFLLPFIFFPYNRSRSPFESSRFIYSFIASNTFLICFYYLNSWIFIPSILARKKIGLYVLIVLGCFFLYLTMLYQIAIHSEETKAFLNSNFAKKSYYKGPFFFSGGAMTLFLLAFVVSSGSKVIEQWFSAEEIKEEISRQQLQTELTLLKSQVNPHFLFNTLNSIYSLALVDNKKTADAVIKLSRIMRYTLEESQNDFVTLAHEIEFINSYIELQKMRLTENVKIIFLTSGNIDQAMIAPLLFIPFIENAFKYGISTRHPSTIDVSISVENNILRFLCKNDCFISSAGKNESTGTGIINTKRRLELLYPKKHELRIDADPQHYEVFLTVNLNL